MEKVIINDLSIKRQGEANFPVIKEQLLEIAGMVSTSKKARSILKCSRATVNEKLAGNLSLIEFVSSFPRDDKNRVLTWLSNSGPFWDDFRTEVDLDYFTYNNLDVTEQGLGELGRLHSGGIIGAAFSFQESSENIYIPTLSVVHGIDEIHVGNYEIQNFWHAHEFLSFIEKIELSELDSWKKMLAVSKDTYPGLNISANAISELLSTPFTKCAARKIICLLTVLNEIVRNTDDSGVRNERAQRLIDCHFIGENADFTDESERNKRDFQADLTFSNDAGVRVFAPWHGKVNSPKIRVHFEWPLPQGNSRLDVYYIGPKITKR